MSESTHETTGGDLSIQHVEDARGGAFHVDVGGERLAEMTYTGTPGGHATIVHTNVSDRLGGRGVGKRLVVAAVEWARATGTRITPRCPFARAVIERDPSLQDVLAHGA
jgi:predicted GNAT family acetyltransferase